MSIFSPLYTNFGLPIIFLYTKAHSLNEEDIESIKEGLAQFSFLKENPNNFHFLEIILSLLLLLKYLLLN